MLDRFDPLTGTYLDQRGLIPIIVDPGIARSPGSQLPIDTNMSSRSGYEIIPAVAAAAEPRKRPQFGQHIAHCRWLTPTSLCRFNDVAAITHDRDELGLRKNRLHEWHPKHVADRLFHEGRPSVIIPCATTEPIRYEALDAVVSLPRDERVVGARLVAKPPDVIDIVRHNGILPARRNQAAQQLGPRAGSANDDYRLNHGRHHNTFSQFTSSGHERRAVKAFDFLDVAFLSQSDVFRAKENRDALIDGICIDLSAKSNRSVSKRIRSNVKIMRLVPPRLSVS
jgi:hypothetical protein